MAENPLLQVVTMAEAARLWHVRRDTVRKAILTRHKPLQARKTPRGWLITYASCVNRWGEPSESLFVE